MKLTPITIERDAFPAELRPFLENARLFDSSSSPKARVIFIDRGDGFFLKSAPLSTLRREAEMTQYFHKKGLAAEVLFYLSDGSDWLLTPKIRGDDLVAAAYLAEPKRLCDTFAELLARLHAESFADCPIPDHTAQYLAQTEQNMRTGAYNSDHFPDSYGYASAQEAWRVIEAHRSELHKDTLLHGDYCLPNVILNNWQFCGFVDLDNAGVGDRHVDIFWALWSLWFNLKTDKYRERFIDAYGRSKVDEDILRLIAAVEVFG